MNKKDFILPDLILDKLTEADLNTAFVCHSELFGKEIGGIMVVTNTEALNKMGLLKKPGMQPQFNLRIYSDKTLGVYPIYLLEFQGLFGNNMIVNVHLNPKEKAFRNFCKQCIKSDMQSLHFYNIDNHNTISIHVELDGDFDWYQRNLIVSKSIRSNSFFKTLSDQVIYQNSNQNTFYFFQNKKIKFAGF